MILGIGRLDSYLTQSVLQIEPRTTEFAYPKIIIHIAVCYVTERFQVDIVGKLNIEVGLGFKALLFNLHYIEALAFHSINLADSFL